MKTQKNYSYDELSELQYQATEAKDAFLISGDSKNLLEIYDKMQMLLKPKYPVIEIMKRHVIGRKEKPLMIRWNIINTRWFSIRIHKFISSDHNCLHDHPWNFLTLILKGGYYEKMENRTEWRKPGTILFRRAEHKHSVQLKTKIGNSSSDWDNEKQVWNLRFEHLYIPSYSLFISLNTRRKWGFWSKLKWTEWKFFNSDSICE